jgi:predicted DNA-binding antitoxin AbrB/MazE fold protein
MKKVQKVLLDGEQVIVVIHNVESTEEALDILDAAQPLDANDINEYEGTKFLHLNSGIGYKGEVKFTKDTKRAGASTTCVAAWEEF